MGYWPASVGASLASGRRVICITGDGCLQMNIQELATVVKNKLNIKIFVLNNDGYLLIRHTQKKYFGKLAGESPKTGLGFPDLEKIANAYGIRYDQHGWNQSVMTDLGEGYKLYPTVLTDNDLRQTIYSTLKGKDPVLCEIKTPKWEKSQGRLDTISKIHFDSQTY